MYATMKNHLASNLCEIRWRLHRGREAINTCKDFSSNNNNNLNNNKYGRV
jgi:hypothetical protein